MLDLEAPSMSVWYDDGGLILAGHQRHREAARSGGVRMWSAGWASPVGRNRSCTQVRNRAVCWPWFGDGVAVAVWDADDEAAGLEAAQVVGGLPGGDRPGLQSAQLGGERA
jgi:hypothetical protein